MTKDIQIASLKGIPALIAIVVLAAGFIGYRMFLQSNLIKNTEVRRQLEMNLQSEIAGDIMNDTQAIRQAIDQGDKAKAEKLAHGTVQRRVEIKDLAMKGSGDDIILKAHYVVHGPQGSEPKVGYFKYSHSSITGWRYHRQTTPMSWQLKLF